MMLGRLYTLLGWRGAINNISLSFTYEDIEAQGGLVISSRSPDNNGTWT